MTDLQDFFRSTAENVPAYDVAPAVLQAVRRRRQVVRLTPVAAAVAALAIVMSAVLLRPSSNDPAPVFGGPASSGKPSNYLNPSPPVLPFNDFHGMASGALVYRACAVVSPGTSAEATGSCSDQLLTVTGLQYSLTGLNDEALSPEGRWFTYTDGGTAYKLRDLNGTGIADLGNRHPEGWSADGKWLALTADPTPGQPVHSIEVVTVPGTHGTTVTLPGSQRRPFAGITSDGSAVFGPTKDTPGVLVVARDGTSRTVPVPAFADGANGHTVPGLDEDAVVIVANDNILRIDVPSGAILQQIPLAPSFTLPVVQTSGHRVVVLAKTGYLLETIDLVTGRNTIVNELPVRTYRQAVQGDDSTRSSFRFAGCVMWHSTAGD